jgi:hypothetical protein
MVHSRPIRYTPQLGWAEGRDLDDLLGGAYRSDSQTADTGSELLSPTLDCYDDALEQQLEDITIELEISVLQDGSVGDIIVEPADTAMARCLAELVAEWHFPAGRDHAVLVNVPLSFRVDGER